MPLSTKHKRHYYVHSNPANTTPASKRKGIDTQFDLNIGSPLALFTKQVCLKAIDKNHASI